MSQLTIRHLKGEKPRIAAFLAQIAGAMVGEGKKFKDHWELCRALATEGYEAVTVPAAAPFVDLEKATTGTPEEIGAYCNYLHKQYEDCGVKLIRLEAHVPGDCVIKESSSYYRFFGLLPEDMRETAGEIEVEDYGLEIMLKTIDASANLGLPNVVAFSGGRAFYTLLYPWPAYPAQLQQTVLALVLTKWRSAFERAVAHGVKICFELHPGQDLFSPILLSKLRDMMLKVCPELVPALSANGDASHPQLLGDDGAEWLGYLIDNNLLHAMHLKDGRRIKCPGGSSLGDFESGWSKTRRTFTVFGLGDTNWDAILPKLLELHKALPYGLDFVVEAECSYLPNMWQGVQVGLKNAIRAIKGLPLHGRGDMVALPTDGANWEDFVTDPNQNLSELLQMTPGEEQDVTAILEAFSK